MIATYLSFLPYLVYSDFELVGKIVGAHSIPLFHSMATFQLSYAVRSRYFFAMPFQEVLNVKLGIGRLRTCRLQATVTSDLSKFGQHYGGRNRH